MTFGEMLRRLRERAELTQERLSILSNVSVRTISALERGGRRRAPTMSTLRSLADALELEGLERDRFFAAAAGRPVPPLEEPEFVAPGGKKASVPEPLVKATARLAAALKERWAQEEEHHKVQDPVPLPVHWEGMSSEHMDSWANIHRARGGEAAPPLELTGRLEDIADFYRRIPSGRLVVVGRPGAGKTTLTLRFVLQMLQTRSPGDAVPVIFGIESWSPATTNLRGWLTAQLLRDYTWLGTATEPGGPVLAASLVNEGLILPVLDGFDEISSERHRDVLEALNSSQMPLFLTSRTEDYRDAVANVDVLTSAAGVELADLTVGDLEEYLPRTTVRTRDGIPLWTHVLDRLKEEPRSEAADNLAAVLATPLMVYLARVVYSDNGGPDQDERHPSELLDIEKFPNAAAVETHLLGNLVPAVYRPRGDPRFESEDVQRWLGHLADHLDRLKTQDLAWWQLGTSIRRRNRMMLIAITVAPVFGFVDMIVEALLLRQRIGFALSIAVALGIVAGVAFGLAHGLVSGSRSRPVEPSRIRIRIREPKELPWKDAAHRFRTGLVGGLVTGVGYGVLRAAIYVSALGRDPLQAIVGGLLDAAVFGLIFGLTAGLTFGLMALCEAPLDPKSVASPEDLMRADRATTAARVLLLGLAFAVALPFTGWLIVTLLQQLPQIWGRELLWDPRSGLAIGLIGGIGGGAAYALSLTAWGQWLVFGRIWLPLTRRLPWVVRDFLKDAYNRGVLRRVGVVYRFRHERLQDHLAETYRSRRSI
ncbi:helix-turn-helix domain-containing protein [Glycomyces tritici]|uniref:Helix-turn-helix domain-containing protein n=1 Tax=Glycomyces tritici TaxID=2665176 RepID=A0ABT7YUS0_9ACTN|nr:helix-turn-helix domain-containing protein [Glycomyces tritici]MDN3241998.1 helix-turn-helix domain-containing protein [Glycomyces tritici]